MKDEDTDPMLPLIFTHVYDEVEINSAVPWEELSPKMQLLAEKVVDHYRMRASVNVDAQVNVRALNIESSCDSKALTFSIIAGVEALGDNDIDYDNLFPKAYDDDDE